MDQKNTNHIFIVGLGRTGSTLTRHILNASGKIGLGGESHYLRDLPRLGFPPRQSVRQKLARVGNLATDDGATRVVDYLFTVRERHMNFWNFSALGVDRHAFLQQVLDSDRSERAFFDLAMGVHAGDHPVRGEKTPAHIFFVPQLLAWYPQARVIHTFRDPRAVYASRKRKGDQKQKATGKGLPRAGMGFEFLSSLHVILNWARVARLHEKYQANYPGRYQLLKYEDLVLSPQKTLQDLCNFLGVELTETMFAQTVTNSSYLPDGAAGFDAGAVTRWRAHMDPTLKGWFSLWCRSYLQQFGYPA